MSVPTEKVVVNVEKNDGTDRTSIHPNVQKAVEHAVKELGKPKPASDYERANVTKVRKAIEGAPLPDRGLTVPHENGYATFTPAKETP